MSLHPEFRVSPYAPLLPAQRWFPADEALRATAYEKLLPPLVAKVRQAVFDWRTQNYLGAAPTSIAFQTLEHIDEPRKETHQNRQRQKRHRIPRCADKKVDRSNRLLGRRF